MVNTDLPASAKQTITNTAAAEIPSGQVDEYDKVCAGLDILQKKSGEFLGQGYTEENVLVKDMAEQITKARELKKNLEEKYPGLVNLGVPSSDSGGQSAASSEGSAKLTELKSNLVILNEQLNQLRSEAITVGEAEPKIMDLQRKQQIQENNLQYFLKKSG